MDRLAEHTIDDFDGRDISRALRDAEAAAFLDEQSRRARRMFSAVVMTALDDAVKEEKAVGTGIKRLARWARSRDGREVLSFAGINPTERAVEGMLAFVRRGVTKGKG